MRKIEDKLVILALCLCFTQGQRDEIAIVGASLAAVALSALNGYLDNKIHLAFTVCIYTIASFLLPYLRPFLPLIQYDAFTKYHESRNRLWLASGITSVFILFGQVGGLTTLIVSAASCLLSKRTVSFRLSLIQKQKLRTKNHEITALLRQTREELAEKYGYQIHLATLDERSRIAREIHDHVGHLLSRAILQSGALMIESSADVHPQISTLHHSLSQAMDQIRSSVHNLHEDSLDLQRELTSLVENFAFCPARLDYKLKTAPTKKIAYCFLAVVKEGLNNIIKHSNATFATITLVEHPALYQLFLQDNGTQKIRHQDKQTFQMGMGLKNMAHRAETLDGSLTVEHKGGFRIFVSIPKKHSFTERETAV